MFVAILCHSIVGISVILTDLAVMAFLDMANNMVDIGLYVDIRIM